MPATSLPATLVAALCLLCGVIAQGANYVDDASFDYSEPLPPRSAPRPAPAYRPTNLANAPKPTPVPILKQINRHNEDGSYTYGYEGADGAFKIETKLPNGEVMGKYGYVDESGKVRVVEYGANKYGFQPAGEGITVPPPTLVDESTNKQKAAGRGGQEAKDSVEYDDGQYYEEAPVRAAPQQPLRPAARPAPRPAPQPQYTPEDTFSSFSATRPAPRPAPQPQYTPQDTFSSFSSSQNFGPSRPVSASSVGPVPPRAAIPGAIPAGPAPSYSQPRAITAPLSRPLSASRQQQPTQGFFSPAPAPVYENRPVASSYEPRPSGPVPQRASYGRSTGSILDQLEKDYALPQNSAPALHDITFGSF